MTTRTEALEFLRAFIVDRGPFRFASTMPEAPHQYVVRRGSREPGTVDAEFDRVRSIIQEYGYDRPWGRNVHRYLDLDGWRYWVIFPVLNRALLPCTRCGQEFRNGRDPCITTHIWSADPGEVEALEQARVAAVGGKRVR